MLLKISQIFRNKSFYFSEKELSLQSKRLKTMLIERFTTKKINQNKQIY